jgi:Fe-S-cluster containining protein
MFKIVQNGKILMLTNKDNFVKAGTREDLKSFIDDTNSKPKKFRNKFHCLPNCTECCHQYVDVSETEIFKIRRELRKLDKNFIQRVRIQEREDNVCPLLDIENRTCLVYKSRPDICKAFGHYTGALSCSYNLDVELEPVEDYLYSMLHDSAQRAGKLGVDFTWEKGLIREEIKEK